MYGGLFCNVSSCPRTLYVLPEISGGVLYSSPIYICYAPLDKGWDFCTPFLPYKFVMRLLAFLWGPVICKGSLLIRTLVAICYGHPYIYAHCAHNAHIHNIEGMKSHPYICMCGMLPMHASTFCRHHLSDHRPICCAGSRFMIYG